MNQTASIIVFILIYLVVLATSIMHARSRDMPRWHYLVGDISTLLLVLFVLVATTFLFIDISPRNYKVWVLSILLVIYAVYIGAYHFVIHANNRTKAQQILFFTFLGLTPLALYSLSRE